MIICNDMRSKGLTMLFAFTGFLYCFETDKSPDCFTRKDEYPVAKIVVELIKMLEANQYAVLDYYVFSHLAVRHYIHDPATCRRRKTTEPLEHADDKDIARLLFTWFDNLYVPLVSTKKTADDKCDPIEVASRMSQTIWSAKKRKFIGQECLIGTNLVKVELLLRIFTFGDMHSHTTRLEDSIFQARAMHLSALTPTLFAFFFPELADCITKSKSESHAYVLAVLEEMRRAGANLKLKYHAKRLEDAGYEPSFDWDVVARGIPPNPILCVDGDNNPKGPPVFNKLATKFEQSCLNSNFWDEQTKTLTGDALLDKIASDPKDSKDEIQYLTMECVYLARGMLAFVKNLKARRQIVHNEDHTSALINTLSEEPDLCSQTITFRFVQSFHAAVEIQKSALHHAFDSYVIYAVPDIRRMYGHGSSNYQRGVKYGETMLEKYDETHIKTYIREWISGYNSVKNVYPPPPAYPPILHRTTYPNSGSMQSLYLPPPVYSQHDPYRSG